VAWILAAMVRVRRLNKRAVDPALITLSASMCGALVVVMVAGNTADYLMAEVQFWLYAALVSALQFGESARVAATAGTGIAPRLDRLPA